MLKIDRSPQRLVLKSGSTAAVLEKTPRVMPGLQPCRSILLCRSNRPGAGRSALFPNLHNLTRKGHGELPDHASIGAVFLLSSAPQKIGSRG